MALWGLFGSKKAPAGLIKPIQNLFRAYPEDTVTPTRYKQILKNADIGVVSDYMELLDAASNDYKISSVLRTRKLSVAAADWCVEPAKDVKGDNGKMSSSDEAKKIADETGTFLDSIPNFLQMKMDILDAHYRGFSSGRLVREMADGVERAVGWDPLESRFFYFEDAETPLVMTVENPSGEPLPPEYIYHVVRDKPGAVTRGGTGRSISKMWVYKGYFTIWMSSHIEKHASPHVQVKIPNHYVEGSPELARAKDAARSFIMDHIGLVPADVTMEILESIKQTSTVKDTYIAAIQFCDEAIAMAETGHTLTSAGSTVGGLGHGGEAKQAGDVKQEIKVFDAAGLAEVINTQIIWPRHIRQYGEKAPRPSFCIDVEEPEDELDVANAQLLRAQTRQILATIGLPQSKSEMYEEFEACEPMSTDDELTPPAPPPTPADPNMPPKKMPPKK